MDRFSLKFLLFAGFALTGLLLLRSGRLAQFLALNLGVITALSLLGRKFFCGWACPLGAFQELAYLVPAPLKLTVEPV